MLQSGNGCDELNWLPQIGSRKEAAQKHFNRRSGQSAQLIPQQLRREPIKALQVWHHADNEILGGHR
jgi:hypothetical protein